MGPRLRLLLLLLVAEIELDGERQRRSHLGEREIERNPRRDRIGSEAKGRK